jgi:hypothetical protein
VACYRVTFIYVVFQVRIKLTPLLLPKGKVQCVPAADIFEESLDTQDVPEERDRWSVTEIAVSSSYGNVKFKLSTL